MMGSFPHWSLPSSDGTRGSCSSDAHEEVSTDSFALRLGARRMRYALRPAVAEGHAGAGVSARSTAAKCAAGGAYAAADGISHRSPRRWFGHRDSASAAIWPT
jgi:hypothetical protein